jgi:hypothetical protein
MWWCDVTVRNFGGQDSFGGELARVEICGYALDGVQVLQLSEQRMTGGRARDRDHKRDRGVAGRILLQYEMRDALGVDSSTAESQRIVKPPTTARKRRERRPPR